MACHCDYCEKGFGSYCVTEKISELTTERDTLKAELEELKQGKNEICKYCGIAKSELELKAENAELREALGKVLALAKQMGKSEIFKFVSQDFEDIATKALEDK